MNLTLEVAKGAMHALSNGGACDILESNGILPEEMELLKGQIPWNGTQRAIITRSMDSLMFGTMDLIGLPRFNVPAEYVAACIAMFVAPVNYMTMCNWMEGGSMTKDLANPNGGIGDPVQASQLFALLLMLQNDGTPQLAKAQFEKRTNMKIKEAVLQGVTTKKP